MFSQVRGRRTLVFGRPCREQRKRGTCVENGTKRGCAGSGDNRLESRSKLKRKTCKAKLITIAKREEQNLSTKFERRIDRRRRGRGRRIFNEQIVGHRVLFFLFFKNQACRARRVSHVPGSSVTRNNWGSTRLHVRPGDARAFLRVGLVFDGRPSLIVNRGA